MMKKERMKEARLSKFSSFCFSQLLYGVAELLEDFIQKYSKGFLSVSVLSHFAVKVAILNLTHPYVESTTILFDIIKGVYVTNSIIVFAK